MNAANEVLYQKKTPFFRISEYEPYYILGKIDVSDFKSASKIYFRITLLAYDNQWDVIATAKVSITFPYGSYPF